MIVNTKAYGQIEVSEKQVIEFPHGLLGFEYLKEFVLLDASQQPFFWLQCKDVKEIAFVLINPLIFNPQYEPAIDEITKNVIELDSPEDLLLFAIVTIPEDSNQMTANLQGPVLINKKKRIGIQGISSDPRWKVRHRILSELKKQRTSSC
ncbi:flagellar assembly protein FliW [Spirochaeta cellobiosiphila]|uniref:flagellar assembly protein FliW n=1 Tax=Spirochaeta cellobiosiphila TaxID=504483 RepID=UPI0003FDAFD4|nr:flagellar assembly protein FliW [Spirochaeta cellobiosiphila]